MDTPAQIFGAWSNFYIIIGSSAAALTGLMFVVVTLVQNSSRLRMNASEGFGTFTTPTVMHFCAAFLLSAVLSAPWRSIGNVGAIIAAMGLFGICYVAGIIRRTANLTTYDTPPEDWLWYNILPFISYAAMFAGAMLIFTRHALFGLYLLAIAALLLIFIGIHNAWDIVTYITIELGKDEKNKPPDS